MPSDPLTPAEIEDLRAVEKMMTKAPWGELAFVGVAPRIDTADVQGMIYLRNAAPRLLATIDALTAERDALRHEMDTALDDNIRLTAERDRLRAAVEEGARLAWRVVSDEDPLEIDAELHGLRNWARAHARKETE